jgi:hypothetical protein
MSAFRGIWPVALMLVWVLCVGPPASADTPRDGRLTLRSRQALFADPDLAACNLGVSVQDGVATLIGTVPTNDLAARAVERLRRVAGLLDVQSELKVVAPADPPTPRPAPAPAALTSGPSTETRPRPPSGEEIVLAVERLRRLDARYRGLRAELHGRVVILRGEVARGEDATDLARAVAGVPGVERVVLQRIQTVR